MQEVAIKIKFITPCLGHIRRDDYDRFERDDDNFVIFMASWWREVLRYGAQALGKHQKLVNDVRMHARVIGEVKRYKRYFGAGRYKEHEAFAQGDTILVKAMLPTGLPPEDFDALLKLAGNYRGISPYGWKDGYGQFDCARLEPIRRKTGA